VEGIYDLRIKAVLDNGVEIRELLLDAEMTHQLDDIALIHPTFSHTLSRHISSQTTGRHQATYPIIKYLLAINLSNPPFQKEAAKSRPFSSILLCFSISNSI